MKKYDLLSDERIGQNLKSVISSMGLTQKAFGNLIGKQDTHVSNYIKAKDGCLAKNLLPEVVTFGFNGTWYLTGEGEMRIPDSTPRQDIYEDIDKKIAELKTLFEQISVREGVTPYAETGPKKKAGKVIHIPLYAHSVAAGRPSDSSSFSDQVFDFPAQMLKHPKETYAVNVSGDSMTGAGIKENDILIVDRIMEPKHKSIVIASINGEQMVKRLLLNGDAITLSPENHNYPATNITEEMSFSILGVVIWIIRKTA